MGDLQDEAIRQHCKTLRMPTIGGQFARLAEAAAREGRSHVGYLERRTRIVVTALALPADEKVRAGEGASNPGLYWEATRLKSPLFSPLS